MISKLKTLIGTALFTLLVFDCSILQAQEEEELDLISTSHTLILPGQKPLEYTATTGTLPIANAIGIPVAQLFFISYTIPSEEERPVTFIFPGGPGGSCAAEVISTIGPRRLLTPQEGKSLLPPYRLVDNPETLLPWTDLVFVDPVNTGFSRFTEDATEEDSEEFLSVDGDIASLGNFIQVFVSYFERWNAPKYLAGISYGTLRSCGLTEYLRVFDLSIHGIILLGSAIDYSVLLAQRNQPLADCLLIPTFAATAWYHGRLWPERSLEEVVEYARRFAYENYAPFMLEPTRLSQIEKGAFYKELAHLIGLSSETVQRYCARFDERLYTTEFMASERKLIGGLDTRYIGDLSDIERLHHEDPSYQDAQGLFCAFNAYLQQELETRSPFHSYATFSSQPWNFSSYDSIAWPEVLQRLRRTLIQNPQMKIFSGSGYYDCRTPFAATEYCFEHLDLPPSYKQNFQFEYYEAGHGFIFYHPCLKKLKKDLVAFYEKNGPS
jgi:carboxypeptidase C (cathepsin A)